MFLYHPQPGRKDPRVLGPLNPLSLSETSQDPPLLPLVRLLLQGQLLSLFQATLRHLLCHLLRLLFLIHLVCLLVQVRLLFGQRSLGTRLRRGILLLGRRARWFICPSRRAIIGICTTLLPSYLVTWLVEPRSFGLYRLIGTAFGIPFPWTRTVNSSGGLVSVLTLCHCGAATHRRTALIGLTRCRRYANWRGISGQPLLWRIRTPNPPAKERSTSCFWSFSGLQGHSCTDTDVRILHIDDSRDIISAVNRLSEPISCCAVGRSETSTLDSQRNCLLTTSVRKPQQ